MSLSHRSFLLLFAIASLLTLGLTACGEDDPGTETENLEDAVSAHQPYTSLSAALADGYVNTRHFIAEPNAGGMGVHFVNPTLEGIDPMQAHVLVYDVDESGNYQLGAIEWFVPADQFEEAPTLFGETFEGPMPGHEPDQPEHYELHAWTFIDNPAGQFASFNPSVEAPSWWSDAEATLEATSEFMDVSAAEAAGYAATPECVSNPEGDGAMGIHYVNESIQGVDPTQPNVLIYLPDAEGNLTLAAVEWFIPSDAVTEAPQLFGQTFEGPMPGHEPDQPEHYELHAWFYMANPDGIFAPFNPAISCP